MKEDQDIDKLFKASLEQREFEIKPAFLDDLNNRLDALETKRKFPLLWLAIGGSLLGIVLIVFFLGTDAKKDVLAQKRLLTEELDSVLGEIKQTTLPSKNESDSSFEFSSEVMDESAQLNHDVVAVSSEGHKRERGDATNLIDEKSTVATEVKQEYRTNDNVVKERIQSNNEQNVIKEVLTDEQLIDSAHTVTRKGVVELSKEQDTLLDDSVVDENTRIESVGSQELDGEGLEDDTASTEEVEEAQETEELKEETKSESSSDENTEPKSPNLRWSLALSGGMNYVAKSTEGDGEYLTKRKEEEQSIITAQVNFGVRYDWGRMAFATGMNYTEYGENVSYTPVSFTQTDVSYDTTYVQDTIGGAIDTVITPIASLSQLSSDAVTQANGKNRYRYITIPLSVGYRFQLGSQFTITPKVGVGLRFALGSSGKYTANNLMAVVERKEKAFQLSYHGSLELAYRMKNFNLEYFIEPRFQSNMQSFHSLHRYWSVGGTIGLRYYLKGKK